MDIPTPSNVNHGFSHNADEFLNIPIESTNLDPLSIKYRSSSCTIKCRKFNDELVETTFNLQPPAASTKSTSRSRTVSISTTPMESIVPEQVDQGDQMLLGEKIKVHRGTKFSCRHRWQVLVDSVTGVNPPDFDNQTSVILRGRLVRYLMRSREITVGCSTKDHNVDVDLTLVGPAWKVLRRQGTIRLRNNGDFFLSSEGKRPIFVDRRPILAGNKMKIAGLRFRFLINQELISVICQEVVKLNLKP
ncbi:Microspherule protein 1 [Habropoda laboriosa]|uniref:Microspherule protein 1 n=1 Tax=Habropoda laboriosa TaxID=597456 RepID=A0A0L7RH52_9HYME|nr:Microspherule protein 1 [Habropoda laboriosa]